MCPRRLWANVLRDARPEERDDHGSVRLERRAFVVAQFTVAAHSPVVGVAQLPECLFAIDRFTRPLLRSS
jgi:hypothetical protein